MPNTTQPYNCSLEAGKEYEIKINKYLLTNGINDFTKYKFFIKKDKVHFSDWEYSNVEQPTNISTITNVEKPRQMNYVELYSRLLIINLPDYITQVKYFNVDGDEVRPNYKDKDGRKVQKILSVDYRTPGKKAWETSKSDISVIAELVCFRNKTIKGEVHISILMRNELYEQGSLMRNDSQSREVLYPIPKNFT
jgi:hypothetical protein